MVWRTAAISRNSEAMVSRSRRAGSLCIRSVIANQLRTGLSVRSLPSMLRVRRLRAAPICFAIRILVGCPSATPTYSAPATVTVTSDAVAKVVQAAIKADRRRLTK
jgi:hypothetical protein